jgi:formate-dependent phosphoribosylglycinamide formyltransferase (GAR transformylase)
VLNHFLIPPIDTVAVSTLEQLRPNTPASVEDLVGRIAQLVLERQSLRSHGAESLLLERNRLALVHAHQDLSRALIARHCPPKAEAAEAAA